MLQLVMGNPLRFCQISRCKTWLANTENNDNINETGEAAIPIISDFYGITISIHTETNERHHLPHIHARYGDDEASIGFDGEIIKGKLHRPQLRLVQAWIEIHRSELIQDWEIATAGEKAFRIDPLK